MGTCPGLNCTGRMFNFAQTTSAVDSIIDDSWRPLSALPVLTAGAVRAESRWGLPSENDDHRGRCPSELAGLSVAWNDTSESCREYIPISLRKRRR
jgi:hypothetical protein